MAKQLPLVKELKQKLKGTWDSPCIEVCTYKAGHPHCRACGMTRAEKKTWPRTPSAEKTAVAASAAERIKTLVH